MNTPPRRARFQIHLSTAIVLMFVAGGLIWANCQWKKGRDLTAEELRTSLVYIPERTYGWPWVCCDYYGFQEIEWDKVGLCYNLALALTILFAVWFLCEWLIRRRAARKGV